MYVLLVFLLVVGPLIFFHELGHFVTARWFGVHCYRFAIGFGPPIARFERWDTEFSVRALPFGGYVLMLGAMPGEQTSEELEGKSLVDKPVWQRAIISFAGPLMNVLIAIPIFMILAGAVNERPAAAVGFVSDGSAAAEAGLLPGDEFVSIDGTPVRYFTDVQRIVRQRPEVELDVEILRDGETMHLTVVPERIRVRDEFVRLRVEEVGQIGVGLYRYGSFVHVTPGTPAADAGLATFDQVISIDGQPVDTWIDVRERLRERDGPITMRVLRPGDAGPDWGSFYLRDPADITLPDASFESLGVTSAQTSIWHVDPGSPADEAGLRRGDRITLLEDRAVSDIGMIRGRLVVDADEAHTLTVDRAGELVALEVTPRTETVVGDFRAEQDTVFVGFTGLDPAVAYRPPEVRTIPTGQRVVAAFVDGCKDTVEALLAIILGVFFLVTGQVDSSNLGGPMLIADVAARASAQGVLPLLRMGAIISLNLAVLNLLPLPGLDGGNLSLLGVEAVRRRPLSMRTRQIVTFVGFVSVVLLVLFALYNDIARYWADIAAWLNS